MKTNKTERWISIDEAADHLGVKVSTIRKWIRNDTDVPARRVGKLWKFKYSELDSWVKSGRSAL